MPRSTTPYFDWVDHPHIAPGVRRGLELPHQLCDWTIIGGDWFRDHIYDFFADLPTRASTEDPTAFALGARRVLPRLTRDPCVITIWPGTLIPATIELNNSSRDWLGPDGQGLGTLVLTFSANAPDQEIIKEIKKLIRAERARLRWPAPRPHIMSISTLKFEYIAYVLDRSGWDVNSIEVQSVYMGCEPLSPKTNLKARIRKIRIRFRKIVEQIIEETEYWRTEQAAEVLREVRWRQTNDYLVCPICKHRERVKKIKVPKSMMRFLKKSSAISESRISELPERFKCRGW